MKSPKKRRNTRGRGVRRYPGENRKGVARTTEEILQDEIGKFYEDPLGYVMFNFPWDEDPSIQIVELAEGVEEWMTDEDRARRAAYRQRFPNCKYGPDLWACDFLTTWGDEIKKRGFDGRTPVPPIYFATVSGHEIGKSMLVALIIKFIMDTRPHSKGSVTAVTDEQLRTKTWAELGKWHNMSLTKHWFKFNSSRGNMSLIHRDHPQWRCDAKTCREEKSEAFAGQHAPMATSFYIFDEASGVPNKLSEVREGGLTSGEPMVFDFGNGTQNSGFFYDEVMGSLRDRYIVFQIDSRSVAITNKEKIEQDRIDRGEDSDFFKVRWMGLFPDRGFTQFIGGDLVEAAMSAPDLPGVDAPLVLGVDVARFGNDDTVIWPRRGLDARTFQPTVVHGFDTTEVLDQICRVFNEFKALGTPPAMIFVDQGNTGGAVVDFLRKLGYPVIAVDFGATKTLLEPDNYRFKSDEIWGRLRKALQEGLRLPHRNSTYGERIYAEATQREYGFMAGTTKMHLESKADMKSRGVGSPDMIDALAVTYAQEVFAVPQGMVYGAMTRTVAGHQDYDPLEKFVKEMGHG